MDEIFEIRPAGAIASARERDRVLRILRQALPDAQISEVGSTAVEGAIGKEDVDIAVLVPTEAFEAARITLDQVFERDFKQLSSSCYQGYRASRSWDVAVQLTVKGGPHDAFHAFASILRSRPDVLAAYNDLKRHWDGKPMSDYRQAKAAFIEHLLEQHARDSRQAE